VLGLAFKPGTSDIRDAAALDVIGALAGEGARVRAYDPQAMESARRLLPSGVALVSTPEEAAQEAEALVLLTEWDEIIEADWASIVDDMRRPKFLFDGRNALDATLMTQLGFEYVSVGRGQGVIQYDQR
jgi:UDPglucose 6-dehydrogenase